MLLYMFFFFFKQKTAYEMRISDWSSDVCSSDLISSGSRWADVIPRKIRRSLEASGTSICFSPNSVLRHFCSRIRQTCRNSTRQGSRSRSEEHTSELQSLMRISYAVFCLTKKPYKLTPRHAQYIYHTSSITI